MTRRPPIARAGRLARAVATLALFAPHAVRAQRAAPVPAMQLRPALRLDAIVGHDIGMQAAAGVAIRPSYNVRLAMDLGAGATRRGDRWQPAGRVDLLVRWLTDPFRERRRGLSAGGGIGLQVERSRAPRPVAIVTVGVEGSGDGSWVRGVELGLGGGVRVGMTLRRAPPGQR